jgi:hypothetical protein
MGSESRGRESLERIRGMDGKLGENQRNGEKAWTRFLRKSYGGKYKMLNKKKIYQLRKTQGREAAR